MILLYASHTTEPLVLLLCIILYYELFFICVRYVGPLFDFTPVCATVRFFLSIVIRPWISNALMYFKLSAHALHPDVSTRSQPVRLRGRRVSSNNNS